jgi:hypothetical protein
LLRITDRKKSLIVTSGPLNWPSGEKPRGSSPEGRKLYRVALK